MKRLPLTVIGGFLGAGKTTLLNHLLRESRGRRIAALVNDFGALNIDAELIAANAGDTIALTNGCVCCSIGDDLSRALARVIEAGLPFDAVIVEASGVSDPWRIAQVGLADPALSLEGVIVLVDASAVLEHSRDPLLADSLERQLRGADLIVVNKTDRADALERERVHAWVERVAGKTPRIEAVNAAVPRTLMEGPALPADRGAHAEACGHGDENHHDHAEAFESWSWRPRAVLSAAALRGLLRDMPAGVLRLKGLVRSDEHGWAELQFAGKHGSLRRCAPPAGDTPAIAVAIGLRGRLPRVRLEQAFGAAEAIEAEHRAPHRHA
jgi:G3E family GTPase